MRDETAELVWRAQILRRVRGQGNIYFPVQLTTSRIGNLNRLIHTLLSVMTIHIYVHTYIHRWSRETGSAVPSRVSPLILLTRAESEVLTHGIPPAFRDGVGIDRQPSSGQSHVNVNRKQPLLELP